MYKRLLALALVFGMASNAPPAFAQTNCAPREIVVQRLTDHFDETQTGVGMQSNTRLIEIWSSHRTGNWTILLTQSNGVSCVLASGRNWHQTVPQAPPEPPGKPLLKHTAD